MPSFSILTLWHTFPHSHPNSGSKGHITWLKNGHIFLKNVLLTLNFQGESHLYANCLCYIFSISLTCLLFKFLSRVICLHIPILTGVRKGHNSGRKISHILLKNVLLKLNFQGKGRLYANCFFHILAF